MLAVCGKSVGFGASPVPSIMMGCTAQSVLSWPLCYACQWLPLKCSLLWSLCWEGRGTCPPQDRWERGVLFSAFLLFSPPSWWHLASQSLTGEVTSIIPTLKKGKLKQKALRW